jgi:two-component system, chemotaxis family, sensor kinase CheA
VVEAQPSDPALAILREQIALLAVRGEGLEGRIASAGRLATNVFPHLGRPDVAERIAGAVTESLGGLDPTVPARAIEAATESPNDTPAADKIEPAAIRTDPFSRSLRVDALVDLTRELTVAKNAIGHIAMLAREGTTHSSFHSPTNMASSTA